MEIKKIHTDNALYQRLGVLKTNRNKRYRYGEFLIEGVRNLNEAVRKKWHICSLVYPADTPLSGWAYDMLDGVKTDFNIEITPALYEKLCGKTDGSELLAVAKMREDNLKDIKSGQSPLILLFDRPSNRGNLGTVIRSCDSFGVDGIIITGHSVDLYDPEVIAATMGSFFSVPCVRISETKTIAEYISSMKDKYRGFTVIGSTAHDKIRIDSVDFTMPTLIMLGNETDGLSAALSEMCDVSATIPMSAKSSASSFNVSCAATAMLYEAMRQREFGYDMLPLK